MKRNKYGRSKLTSRGFYIALAVCLVAVGVATAIAINRTVSDLESPTLEISSQMSDGTAEAAKTQSDVPMRSAQASQPESSTASASEPSSRSQSSARSSQGSAAQAATSQAANEFALPLDGEVINPYSNGELVKSETMGDWRTHDGVDFAASQGTPVKACGDGKVTQITNDPMWGVCITIDHGNNLQSIYCDLNEAVQVKMDQQVRLGDVIGSVGNTSQIEVAQPEHLHLGMKRDSKWIDPLSILPTDE